MSFHYTSFVAGNNKNLYWYAVTGWLLFFIFKRSHKHHQFSRLIMPIIFPSYISCASVKCSCMQELPPVPSPRVKSPPCIMKSLITRWNVLPLYVIGFPDLSFCTAVQSYTSHYQSSPLTITFCNTSTDLSASLPVKLDPAIQCSHQSAYSQTWRPNMRCGKALRSWRKNDGWRLRQGT